ncbi:LysM peptidoglycan-binding domain-containing protein [bacterium]|nr:LysM peptidoglycan-binding domain-containing protein [bacterium]NIN91803.1 LysM peptidoglycan-binding domain-containing protein [bacterium]NIO18089.1 LysM peptidoglycan-binding domain-containing protein [bacterium]NIO73054.1 LysM peptidoglycan-binding domain-containing protein [bacterium]
MKRGIFIFLLCGLLTLSIFFAHAQEEDVEALPPEPLEEEIPAFEVEEEALPPEPSEEEITFEAEEEPVEPSEVPAEEVAVEEPSKEVEEAVSGRRVLPEKDIPEGTELVLKAYEVRRGDCLHEIANRYYDDPSLWEEIWAYNRYIKNPHWIFPGDDLIIPTYQKVEVSEEMPGEEMVVKLEEVKPGFEYERDIFIAPLDFEFAGYIAGVKEKKFMTAYGDIVFIDLGKNQQVKPETRFIIYREGDEVVHPMTGELLGIIIEKIGVLEVTSDIQEDSSTAIIRDSRKPIEVGDPIKLQGGE